MMINIHLFIHINKWEQRSIERIQQVADEVRENVKEHLNTNKGKLERSLNEITTELRSSRDNEDYTEIELQRWLNQLKELRQQLFQPSTIELNHDGDDLLGEDSIDETREETRNEKK